MFNNNKRGITLSHINLSVFFSLVLLGVFIQLVGANTYVTDIYFTVPETVYATNERVELKGYVFQANYSDNGTLVSDSAALPNANVNLTITNTNGTLDRNYTFTTDSNGAFYSRSNYYTSATEVNASSSPRDYNIRAEYIDLNNETVFSEVEITVVNQTIDSLDVSPGKAVYNPSETVSVEVEAIRLIGDRILYLSNVSVSGTLRDSSKTVLESFSCTTGSSGKCVTSVTASASYGNYILEVEDFKAFSSFSVVPFTFSVYIKDELGKSLKNVFALGEQARVEVSVANASTTDVYTFSGYIADSSGSVVKAISSTTLNNNNSFTNSFLFSVDSLTFSYGAYTVFLTVTKTGDGSINATTSFEVKDWTLSVNKKSSNSGFEYEYTAFPNRTLRFEAYPTYRSNGSVIPNINSTFFTINLKDNLNNIFASANTTWNASCGSDGCYEFSFQSPLSVDKYILYVTLTHSGSVQTQSKVINIITGVMSAQSTNKDGDLKELFGTNEFVYLSLTAYNSTDSAFNLSDAEIYLVSYMNGSDFSYTSVGSFDLVNGTNSVYEWAWNSTLQRIKLDVPKFGGVYNVLLFGNNRTLGAVAKFIVNPYDFCIVPKDTPGQAGSGTGYYYVWQFKTSDTIYFEIKATQANNPLGKATASNSSGNATSGLASQCNVDTSTQQVVSNATITVVEVKNMESGALQGINTTASTCQAADSSGGYTCTVKPLTKWEGGNNLVEFNVQSQDGTTDTTYSRFEARAFYLYGWSQTWQNSPSSNITLNVQLYEAGSGWWGSSGGLSGTVTLKKVEYQGRDGEWLWPPVDSGYNVTSLSSATITSGTGTISLPVGYAAGGSWKTGYYRAVLQGTTSSGDTDYGYAWFGVKLWDVYGQPVECTSSRCDYKSYFNSRDNITLYIKISQAGDYSYSYQGGQSLGGNVTIGVKKIDDCRRWPCKELNASSYQANTIIVNASSPWYWGATSNQSNYLLRINSTTGSWGTGYYSVVLNVNGTDTGYAWFNTIAFYVDVRPTDSNGTNYQYSIKPNEPKYFNVSAVKSYMGWWASYNVSNYVNVTVNEAVLRKWDRTTWQSKEYNYPTAINITPIQINGNALLNVTYVNGSWPTGYYYGELTLKNSDNETSTGWLWFDVRPFRIESSLVGSYERDSEECVNTTLNIYEPNWYSSSLLYGNYSIERIYEDVWSGSSRSQIRYTNYTIGSFNATANLTVCPNNGTWGSGSWGGYHYFNIVVRDSSNNTETGWLSFRAVPFRIQWGSVIGGTNKLTSENVIVPVNLTKYLTGQSMRGNLTRLYQWRYDSAYSGMQEYVFSVGNCYSNVSGQCTVNGTQNVTIYPPSIGWRVGYNYIYAVWSKENDASAKVDDWSGIYIDGREVYNGYYESRDASDSSYKYYFTPAENISIKLYVRNSNYSYANVSITNVWYAYSSQSCYSDWCKSYTNATSWSTSRGGRDTTNGGNATIIIQVPSGGWNTGYYYIKAAISGSLGSATVTNGELRVKDMTAPNITINSPTNNQTVTSSTFLINFTTTENSQCSLYAANYNNFNSWYCGFMNSTNSTNSSATSQSINACNTTLYNYNGSSYYTVSVSDTYYSTWDGSASTWVSGSTGLITGGTSHRYTFTVTNWPTQHYGIQVSCYDSDSNYKSELVAFKVNITAQPTPRVNVTLLYPANGATLNISSFTLNYSVNTQSNCTQYWNESGNWSANTNVIANGSTSVSVSGIANGNYLWNVYCFDTTNSSNAAWAASNRTFGVNVSSQNPINVTLLYPANGATLNNSNFTFNFTVNIQSNCSIYHNSSGNWSIESFEIGSGNISSANVNFDNGNYKWNVYCFDIYNSSNAVWGNRTGNHTFTISAPQSPINITATSPSDNAFVGNSSFSFNYTVNILANCTLYWNASGNWSANSSQVDSLSNFFEVDDVSDGNYIWNIYCFDPYNVSNARWANTTGNWTVRVDTTKPLISYGAVTPDNYANLTQNSLFVNVTFTEINFANITFLLWNSTAQVNRTTYTTATYNINWTNLPYTNYTYNVSIYDLAGNFNATSTRNVNLSAS